jgi:hypothetical protein
MGNAGGEEHVEILTGVTTRRAEFEVMVLLTDDGFDAFQRFVKRMEDIGNICLKPVWGWGTDDLR